MTRRWVLVAALVATATACGGGAGDGSLTMAEWRDRHGPAVEEVGTAIQRVQASTKDGEPTAIRANCEGLREAVLEAKATPAAPDAAAETKLRDALGAVETSAGDCVRAMTSGDARLLERSITGLRDAQLRLDTAKAALEG